MIYNSDRLPVWKWDGKSGSHCPDCSESLVARRGELVTWHWAHRSRGVARDCLCLETDWHLMWKRAYCGFDGWDAEVRVDTSFGSYRADAMNVATSRIREFVHSLSASYIAKHRALFIDGFDVCWILDGQQFQSSHRRYVRGGGMRHPLKPLAEALADELDGHVLVHLDGKLWRRWKGDVWYPTSGPAAAAVMDRLRLAWEQSRLDTAVAHG